MAHIDNLTVFAEARELVRTVYGLDISGSLGDQLRRAAVSVASNIAEGCGAGGDRQLARYLRIARGSVNEVQAQLLILGDIGTIVAQHPAVALSDRIGRRLTSFIRRLEGEP